MTGPNKRVEPTGMSVLAIRERRWAGGSRAGRWLAEFLQEFFRLFYNPESAQQAGDDKVVQFFRGMAAEDHSLGRSGRSEGLCRLDARAQVWPGGRGLHVQDGGLPTYHQSRSGADELEAAKGNLYSLHSPRRRSVSRSGQEEPALVTLFRCAVVRANAEMPPPAVPLVLPLMVELITVSAATKLPPCGD
jgi:hypothetical protein